LATLEEILQLDKIQSSIKKIDLFVSQKTKYSREFMLAIAYKGLVLHALGKTNDALKLLYEYIPDIQKIDSESAISLCSSIIEITIDAKVFEQASKYIRLKQTYLPVSRASEYIKDTTRLYLAKHDYENAKDALKHFNISEIESIKEVDFEFIVDVVSRYFEVKIEDIKSRTKVKSVVLARHTVMYLAREFLGYSYQKIADEFGGMNHTSVLDGCNNVKTRYHSDDDVKRYIDALTNMINQ